MLFLHMTSQSEFVLCTFCPLREYRTALSPSSFSHSPCPLTVSLLSGRDAVPLLQPLLHSCSPSLADLPGGCYQEHGLGRLHLHWIPQDSEVNAKTPGKTQGDPSAVTSEGSLMSMV